MVIDLADCPKHIIRGFAPYHPDFKSADNDGNGFKEAINHIRRETLKAVYDYTVDYPRKHHVVAIPVSEYVKLK